MRAEPPSVAVSAAKSQWGNTKMDIQKLIKESDDETLLMQVLETINQQAAIDISQLPDEHRHVLAAVTAQAIIDNGGFRYFFTSHFKGRPDFKMIVDAYTQIGATDAADAIRQALHLFPDGEPPEAMDEREKYIEAIFNENSQYAKSMGEFESKVLGRIENYALAAAYVRENADKFVV